MLSVIIPVRDEPMLDNLLFPLHGVLGSLGEPYEVLVVSGDREKLHALHMVFPFQRDIKCFGDSLERSILCGFSHASGDIILVMDADGTHNPKDIPSMLQALKGHDMVVGSRYVSGSTMDKWGYRRIVTEVFRLFAHESGSHLRDPMSGFFVFRRGLLDNITFKPFKWKTALEIELKARPDVVEVAVTRGVRLFGESKTSILVGLGVLWDLQWEAGRWLRN